MSTFFGGPEPSDGLRMKTFSSVSSTDRDMTISDKVSAMLVPRSGRTGVYSRSSSMIELGL